MNEHEARARARKVNGMLAALRSHLPAATDLELLTLVLHDRSVNGGALLRETAELAGLNTPSDTTLDWLQYRLESKTRNARALARR